MSQKRFRQFVARHRRTSLGVEVVERRQLLATFVVTSAADNGDNSGPTSGSLRAEILLSDASPAPTGQTNLISFNIAGPSTISPTVGLPAITVPTIIDGRTQPNTPVILSGANLTVLPSDGLDLDALDSTIEGLTIDGFDGAAIGVASPSLTKGATGDQILDNFLGTDATGSFTQGLANGDGILLNNAGTTTIQGNVISGNAGNGIVAVGAQAYGNLIVANKIGTNAAGNAALPNTVVNGSGFPSGNGIVLENAPGNTIGGSTAGSANILSGNGNDGVLIDGPDAGFNVVEGNKIGTDVTGLLPLRNVNGIAILNNSGSNTVGGTTSGAGNVIGDNTGDGVEVVGASNLVGSNTIVNNSIGIALSGSTSTSNLIEFNFIGTDAQGTSGLGNNEYGLLIDSAPGVQVDNDVISGTFGGPGVEVQNAALTDFEGDLIGIAPNGSTAIGNQGDGITLANANDTRIAGSYIAGNAGYGIDATGDSANYVSNPADLSNAGLTVVQDNIGVNDAGNASLPNVMGGIYVNGDQTALPAYEYNPVLVIQSDLISGNGIFGVSVTDVPHTVVESSLIGTNVTATAALPNGAGPNGVGGVTITGSDDAVVFDNILSGNSGIGLSLNTSNNFFVGGNEIGVGNDLATTNGAIPLGNSAGGALLSGSGVVEGNTISANGTANVAGGYGLRLLGGSVGTNPAAQLVLGNKIGLSADGTLGRGNQGVGIAIDVGATIEKNFVSANTGAGIESNGSTGSQILGNVIGTGINRTERLGNGGDGIDLVDSGLTSVTGNDIVNNAGNGVAVNGQPESSVSNTYIAYNTIGTLLQARSQGYGNGMGNLGAGVLVSASGVEVIGNIIVSSGAAGVSSTSGHSLSVEYNFIGIVPDETSSVGITVYGVTTALGNGGDGIDVNMGDSSWILGNAIGSNVGNGIHLTDSSLIYVHANAVGTDAVGNAYTLGNRGDGLLMDSTGEIASASNFIDKNAFVNNQNNGVEIEGLADDNTLEANFIGGYDTNLQSLREIASGNAGDGILIGATEPPLSPGLDIANGTVMLMTNDIELNGSAGIQLYGANLVTSRNDKLANNNGIGLEFNSGATGNTFNNTNVFSNQGTGIVFDHSSNNLLTSVYVGFNQGGIVFAQSPGNTLINVTQQNNGSN